MLAKQAWRLIRETHSLFYGVYKARYFHCCSFMEAELGSNPSMVWRSLLQACNVIREGSVWEVGDVRSIGISCHKWLPHPPCFRDEADQDLRECDLINEATHQWDQSILAATFTQATVEDILRIRVDTLNTRDKLTWKENKPRECTVKTVYQVALRLNHPHSGEHSSASQDQRLWKRLWSLNVPSKVKTFMWRACYNVLPTKSNLARQKVQIDPKCSFCGQQDETTQHILWEYPFARNVWALVRGKLQKSSFVTEEFFMLARHMVHRLGGKDLELWAITSWSLWNTQNRF